MRIHTVKVGPLETNCYIVACEANNEAAVIDPGDEGERILDAIKEKGYQLKKIINTHGHWDHIGADDFLKEKTGADILIHEADADALHEDNKNLAIFMGKPGPKLQANVALKEGDTIEIGTSVSLRVIHTPGHTPGSICLYNDDVIFSGDTVFKGSIGRTDLPGGSHVDIIKSIKEKIVPLNDNLRMLPGHGPESTIAEEKNSNPFFK